MLKAVAHKRPSGDFSVNWSEDTETSSLLRSIVNLDGFQRPNGDMEWSVRWSSLSRCTPQEALWIGVAITSASQIAIELNAGQITTEQLLELFPE